jgi:hypothetical protein
VLECVCVCVCNVSKYAREKCASMTPREHVGSFFSSIISGTRDLFHNSFLSNEKRKHKNVGAVFFLLLNQLMPLSYRHCTL